MAMSTIRLFTQKRNWNLKPGLLYNLVVQLVHKQHSLNCHSSKKQENLKGNRTFERLSDFTI